MGKHRKRPLVPPPLLQNYSFAQTVTDSLYIAAPPPGSAPPYHDSISNDPNSSTAPAHLPQISLDPFRLHTD